MAGWQVIAGDCLSVMRSMPSDCIDAIVTDPPYFKVKGEAWDRQWDTPAQFLAWLDMLTVEWHRLLKPNGSIYVFASPRMAARVEVRIAERFNVLNRIRWVKDAGWHKKADEAMLRRFLSPWEEVIFAEHYGADNAAKGEAGYVAACDELRGFLFEPLRAYLDSERRRAGVDKVAVNVACGFSATPGGMAARHYFGVSQWQLPTQPHYEAMRRLFNANGGNYLKREYDDLKREYDDLKREYDDLRRPFNVTADVPYTDVWAFPTVAYYPGKHPCEKPVPLMEHIIRASTRPGAVVLDCFMGTGATGVACRNVEREFIGIEREQRYVDKARFRLNRQDQPPTQLSLEATA